MAYDWSVNFCRSRHISVSLLKPRGRTLVTDPCSPSVRDRLTRFHLTNRWTQACCPGDRSLFGLEQVPTLSYSHGTREWRLSIIDRCDSKDSMTYLTFNFIRSRGSLSYRCVFTRVSFMSDTCCGLPTMGLITYLISAVLLLAFPLSSSYLSLTFGGVLRRPVSLSDSPLSLGVLWRSLF